MLHTIVLPNRHAWRLHREIAAADRATGRRLMTMEQIAARLAGGFLQPIDPDMLADAITSSLVVPLGDLDTIKSLPGFVRAAASTLSRAWSAGIDLVAETNMADGVVRKRIVAISALEAEVLARLPRNHLRPCDLVANALLRIEHAPSLFGPVTIFGQTEMSPVWLPLLSSLSAAIPVTWVAEARAVPEWLVATGPKIKTSPPMTPTIRCLSCANPRHEVLEAMRWVRCLLAQGVPSDQVAMAAASPQSWDDHMMALCAVANIDVHFVHGRPALNHPEGQLAAALAEVLLRGLSKTRMKRLTGLLQPQYPALADLPPDWWRALSEDAPLLDAASWRKAIVAVTTFSDGVDHRPALIGLIEVLAKGLDSAGEIGEALLAKPALAVWRRALVNGPPAALDVTLGSLRIDDGLEPACSVVWAPASALASSPRPYTWLLGLTSRAWPRRASEDPLLPDHIISSTRLDPLPVHQADRRDFASIRAMTARELVCSRARRDSEGRLNGISPLYPREHGESFLAQSREPEHALSPSDRLFARPVEFDGLPSTHSAISAWNNWHTDQITPHDGLIRPGHPVVIRSLNRIQSASSLSKLLCHPLGYLWQYGFGWRQPDETDDPLTLDARSFGDLLHEVLQGAVVRLEATPFGLRGSASDTIMAAIVAASAETAVIWAENRPVPPPVVWKRKLQDAENLALIALSTAEDPLPGQTSWAEVPFGGGANARVLAPEAMTALPWDPLQSVIITGTDIRIGGVIDRLDLAGDQSVARVTDYKSGKLRGKPPQLNGGAELQRCLYAYAVKALIGTAPSVDARLLYPRKGNAPLPLDDPSGTLERLTAYLSAAYESYRGGNALPGPSGGGRTDDLAFALPGGAKESYLDLMSPLVAAELAAVAPLWGEP
jgi:hypothetical protein